MAISVAIGLKTVFCVLGCVMVATLIYTLSLDGLPFRKDLLTPWMVATLIDFYINVIAIGEVVSYVLVCSSYQAWVSYKESNWISASLWVVLLVCFGSITTCCYIVLQLLKLSIGESSEDPIYYVLMRRPSKDGMEHKRRFSVVTTRIIFTALGFLMLGTLLYTLLTDGSPFRTELLTPWMTATLIDFYINVVALSHHNMRLHCPTAILSLIPGSWKRDGVLRSSSPEFVNLEEDGGSKDLDRILQFGNCNVELGVNVEKWFKIEELLYLLVTGPLNYWLNVVVVKGLNPFSFE
ncbi:hypothetical protein TEA_017190 [Camellia sinensis var. sinensis]|uniref:Uncharacterized protein n=1 Tax=Camellia sinensis var. sinensis TaxID=542762 RepID=A0A4S4EQ24_CAMSN|nr:hypothetical protein TEA_017190 [Camellia sinensis var. sinensis]